MKYVIYYLCAINYDYWILKSSIPGLVILNVTYTTHAEYQISNT